MLKTSKRLNWHACMHGYILNTQLSQSLYIWKTMCIFMRYSISFVAFVNFVLLILVFMVRNSVRHTIRFKRSANQFYFISNLNEDRLLDNSDRDSGGDENSNNNDCWWCVPLLNRLLILFELGCAIWHKLSGDNNKDFIKRTYVHCIKPLTSSPLQ